MVILSSASECIVAGSVANSYTFGTRENAFLELPSRVTRRLLSPSSICFGIAVSDELDILKSAHVQHSQQ